MGSTSTRRGRTVVRWLAAVVIAAALVALVRALPLGEWMDNLQAWSQGYGEWAPAAFGIVYILAVLLLVPGSIMAFAAGATFGVWRGAIVVSIAATIAAAVAFLIARYLARQRISELAAEDDYFRAIDDAVAEGGWRIVALLRLSPIVPYTLQNYFYGLTRIRFVPYVITTLLAMLPGTLVNVYVGAATRAVATDGRQRTPWEWTVIAAGAVATIAAMAYLTVLTRRNLHRRLSTASDGRPPRRPRLSVPVVRSVWESWGTAILVVAAAGLTGLATWAQSEPEKVEEVVDEMVEEIREARQRAAAREAQEEAAEAAAADDAGADDAGADDAAPDPEHSAGGAVRPQ